jgi:H+/Cl- antiporter ClcA
VWNMIWPGTLSGAFAIVGAAAFLAASMQMPLTAVVLILEFTRVSHDFLIPILFAVAGSVSTFKLLAKVWAARAASASATSAVPVAKPAAAAMGRNTVGGN